MSKTTKWIVVAVVIAAIIAAIIILKSKKANAATTDGLTANSGSAGSSTTTSAKIFPLKQGVTSDDVKKLQQHLNSKGAALDVDGIFGPKTEAALLLHYNMKEMSELQFNQYVK